MRHQVITINKYDYLQGTVQALGKITITVIFSIKRCLTITPKQGGYINNLNS